MPTTDMRPAPLLQQSVVRKSHRRLKQKYHGVLKPCIGFCQQVELVGEQLAKLGFTRLVISPFQRCLETAKQLNIKFGLPFSSWQIDSGVCEVGA